MKVGVLGLACSHPYSFAEILMNKGLQVDYAWDEDAAELTKYCEKHNVKAVEGLEAFYKLDLDAVFIDVKNYKHCQAAIPFIKQGIGVFIDKPLSTQLQDAKDIIRLAEQSGAILMSCSAMRYMPAYLDIKKRILDGEIGTPVAAVVNVFHNMKYYLEEPNKWQDNIETGGGEIINIAIHGVEPIQMIFGPGVKSVYCTRDNIIYKNAQSEDTAIVLMKFDNGCYATVNMLSCISSFGYDITVYGTKGKIYGGNPPDLDATKVSDPLNSFGFVNMVDRFIEGVQSRTLPIPLDESLEVMKTLFAARLSADNGQKVELRNL